MVNEPETDPVCEVYAVLSRYTSLVSFVGVWCHEEKLTSKSGFHYFSMVTIIVLQILVLLFFLLEKEIPYYYIMLNLLYFDIAL